MTAPLEIEVEVHSHTVSVEVDSPVTQVGLSPDPVVIFAATAGAQGPTGPPGSGAFVTGETPTGLINNTNRVFTTSSAFRTGSIAVYLNGLRESHFTETATNQITLEDPPVSGDSLRVDYVI
jgi:hypothetical protein